LLPCETDLAWRLGLLCSVAFALVTYKYLILSPAKKVRLLDLLPASIFAVL